MSGVYTGLKLFHFHGKLDDLTEGRLTAPIHIRLKPTNRCTHRCSYCAYRNEALLLNEGMDESDEIPWGRMETLITELAEAGVRAVTLSGGGEPLFYPWINEAVDRILEAGLKLAVLTNGAQLEGRVAQRLARDATWVRVSMDAVDAVAYAKIRNVGPDEFETVCRNVQSFASMADRRCRLGINFVVTQENAPVVGRFINLACKLGVDHVKVSTAVVSTDPERNKTYAAGFYDSVKRQVAEGSQSVSESGVEVVDKVFLPEAGAEAFTRDYGHCPFIQCLSVIGADQNVYTCHDKAYSLGGLLGSIRDRSFADLWFSEAVEQRLRSLNPCRECRHHCSHNAVNHALLEYLDADKDHLEFV